MPSLTDQQCDSAGGEGTRPPLLQLRSLTKSYGAVKALQSVDLDVRGGEVVALVGDNGAGKSTLVKAIAGVHQPDGGQILLGGRRVHLSSPQDAADAGIATVYQDLALCNNLDILANLYLGREIRVPKARVIGRFLARGRMSVEGRKVFDQLAITLPPLTTPVGNLSGGQRQAVAVARAILWGSSAVLFDEPTAALGVQQQAMVHSLIRRLRERGLGVLLVSHNLADVFALADRIVVLRLGRTAGTFDPKSTSPNQVVAAITGTDTILSGPTPSAGLATW